MITEKIIQETIFFEPINDFLQVSVRVLAPYAVGSYEKSYTMTNVFCDGECFMDFVIQNNFTEQILDNYKLDRAICKAQDELNLEYIIQDKYQSEQKLQAA